MYIHIYIYTICKYIYIYMYIFEWSNVHKDFQRDTQICKDWGVFFSSVRWSVFIRWASSLSSASMDVTGPDNVGRCNKCSLRRYGF